VYKTIEETVGNTPLVQLQRMAAASGNVVLAKLEGNNPAGSVKDRPALSMVAQAEKRGRSASSTASPRTSHSFQAAACSWCRTSGSTGCQRTTFRTLSRSVRLQPEVAPSA